MELPPIVQSFVLHFGEMGSRWDINRTVGEIYPLLYVSPEPLCADERLEIERLVRLLSLGAKVTKLLEANDKVISLGRGRKPADKR